MCTTLSQTQIWNRTSQPTNKINPHPILQTQTPSTCTTLSRTCIRNLTLQNTKTLNPNPILQTPKASRKTPTTSTTLSRTYKFPCTRFEVFLDMCVISLYTSLMTCVSKSLSWHISLLWNGSHTSLMTSVSISLYVSFMTCVLLVSQDIYVLYVSFDLCLYKSLVICVSDHMRV